MDLHRVRRLGAVLVASQLRSGRSSSDPKSLLGRPSLIGLVDVGLFLGTFSLALFAIRSNPVPSGILTPFVGSILPFVPLIAVAAVLVAGVMFELTTTTKFSSSDSANWLPLTPQEYVAASACAVAYTYSPAIALFLGALLPLAITTSLVGAWALTFVLSIIALFEGAFVVEMVRSLTQRASGVSAGRRGQLTLVLRAALIVTVIVAFQLAFNPVLLYGVLQHSAVLNLVTALVPLLWGTQALTDWIAGAVGLGIGFAFAQLAFVALLLLLAARLRSRLWLVSAGEVRLSSLRYAAGHPVLRVLGLSSEEAALVSKDLRGYFRRRELLPMLVVPIVLIVLVLVEGGAIGGLGAIIWIGWVAGFFALLLALTSVGQERRSLQSICALPITSRTLLRAKLAAVLVPSLIAAVGTSAAIGLLFGFRPLEIVAIALLNAGAAVVLGFWGLVFAGRFSDFQDRPRPQYVRPAAMLAAMGSGMVLLFAIVLPGGLAILDPVPASLGLVLWTLGAGAIVGALGARWARRGFDRLLEELPF